MKILIPLSIFTAILLWYALQGRSWLKSKPWAQGFFEWFEPIEIVLFKKSETILFGRLLSGLGGLLTILSQLGEIDLTPFMPFVPEKYQPFVNVATNCLPLLITVIGWMVEKLREGTTKPLELVAIPDKALAENPVLAEAIATADVAKDEAVAVVETEKKAA